MSDYHRKYLKYKKKYFELKNNLKGGDFPCIIPPSIDIIPNQSEQTLYDIFAIAWYLARYTLTEPSDASTNIIWQFVRFIRMYSYETGLMFVPTRTTRGIELLTPPYPFGSNIILRRNKDGSINYQTRTELLTYINSKREGVILSGIINPNNLEIGLIESVIGNTLGIGCNSAIQSTYEGLVAHPNNKNTYIVDYANIISILVRTEQQSTRLDLEQCKLRAIKRIKLFIEDKCSKGHFVIIVYKPRYGDEHNVSMSPDGTLFNDESRDFLLNNLFRASPAISVFRPDILTDNIKTYLENGLLQIPAFYRYYPRGAPTGPKSSNYDDLVFWMLGISFYKIYERFGNIANIHFVTNDTQSELLGKFKNILDIGSEPIYQLRYYVEKILGVNKVNARFINRPEEPGNLLAVYLTMMYQAINLGISISGQGTLMSDSTLNGPELYNRIIGTELFNIGPEGSAQTIWDYLNPSSPTSIIRTNPFSLEPKKMEIEDEVNYNYMIPYMFQAHIKYIQFKKYGGNTMGSLSRNDIDTLFPRYI